MRRIALLIVPVIVAAMVIGAFFTFGSDDDDGDGGSSGTAGALPTVAGEYGDKPTITFPGGDPSTTLQTKVLREGSGEPLASGDFLVADYAGQIWNGSVFDSSYEGGQPRGFQIGAGQVIPGWDEALVGITPGTRMLLVIPPDKGYGAQGNQQAGIQPTDTLVFVVDAVAGFDAKAAGEADAEPQDVGGDGPRVTGELGEQPRVRVPKGTKPPSKERLTVLARGSGPGVKAGFVVVQYVAVSWNGDPLQATWETGSPTGLPVGDQAQPNPFDALVGVPIGSRVLLELPPQDGKKAATTSVAVVVDVIAEPPTAKESLAG